MFKKSYSIASAPGLALSQKVSCLSWLVLGWEEELYGMEGKLQCLQVMRVKSFY